MLLPTAELTYPTLCKELTLTEVPEHHPRLLDVHLAEYNSIRKEIELRLGWQFLTLSAALPFYGVMLVAIMNSLQQDKGKPAAWATQYPLLLGALVLGSSLLGLVACNQDIMILRLGRYLCRELAPKIGVVVAEKDVLGWEKYTRSRWHTGAALPVSVTVHGLLVVGAVVGFFAFLDMWHSAGSKFGEWSTITTPSPSQWVFATFCALAFAAFLMSIFVIVDMGRELGADDEADKTSLKTDANHLDMVVAGNGNLTASTTAIERPHDNMEHSPQIGSAVGQISEAEPK